MRVRCLCSGHPQYSVQPVAACARVLMISELRLFIFRHNQLSAAREAKIMLATGKIVEHLVMR